MVEPSNNKKAVALTQRLCTREQVIWLINHPPRALFKWPEGLNHYFSQDREEIRYSLTKQTKTNMNTWTKERAEKVERVGIYQAVQVDINRIILNFHSDSNKNDGKLTTTLLL